MDDLTVGHETNASTSNTKYFSAAEYNTTVFSDLTSPSSCGTYCWQWGNWLGTSNYLWGGSVPSKPFFFQVILAYWGGNQGEPSDCGNSFTANCVYFLYGLDSTSLSAYTPNIGGWTAGDSVTMNWATPTQNCTPAGGVTGAEDWTVALKITNDATGQYATHGACFPDNSYLQFFEERPILSGGNLAQNPKFGTHDFSAAVSGTCSSTWCPLNSGSDTWKFNLYNNGLVTELASSTTLSNGAKGSTWSDTWISSTYP